MINLEKFVEFKYGSIPLIISVAHGGSIEYKNIPKRTKGVLGIDKNTIELAKEFILYIEKSSKKHFSTRKSPSYIMSKVPRSQIDINRIETEAYLENSALAKKIYQFYHNKITELINYNLKQFNCSVLIDFHGFEKHKRPQGYRDVELILGTSNLTSLCSGPVPKNLRDKNIRGKIIKQFLELDIPIAPGHPRRREYVLTGGFITRQYGASQIRKSQAIQIEFSDSVRNNDLNLRKLVIKTLSEVLIDNLF